MNYYRHIENDTFSSGIFTDFIPELDILKIKKSKRRHAPFTSRTITIGCLLISSGMPRILTQDQTTEFIYRIFLLAKYWKYKSDFSEKGIIYFYENGIEKVFSLNDLKEYIGLECTTDYRTISIGLYKEKLDRKEGSWSILVQDQCNLLYIADQQLFQRASYLAGLISDDLYLKASTLGKKRANWAEYMMNRKKLVEYNRASIPFSTIQAFYIHIMKPLKCDSPIEVERKYQLWSEQLLYLAWLIANDCVAYLIQLHGHYLVDPLYDFNGMIYKNTKTNTLELGWCIRIYKLSSFSKYLREIPQNAIGYSKLHPASFNYDSDLF